MTTGTQEKIASTLDPVNGRDGFVTETLVRHAQTICVAREICEAAELFASGLTPDWNKGSQVIPVALFVRQISGLRALCVLAVNGFFTEALGHQRTLMEALARISGIAAKPEWLDDYLAQDILNRNKLLDDILKFRRDWEPEIPREPPDEVLRNELQKGKDWLANFQTEHGRKAREIKTFDWAHTGGVDQLLFGRFVISSQALHFSPQSLNHTLVEKDGAFAGVRIGPESQDIDHLVLSSCKYVFAGLQKVADNLSIPITDEIVSLHQRFEALYELKANEALSPSKQQAS